MLTKEVGWKVEWDLMQQRENVEPSIRKLNLSQSSGEKCEIASAKFSPLGRGDPNHTCTL
jgi:hypothetical protein